MGDKNVQSKLKLFPNIEWEEKSFSQNQKKSQI